MESYIGKRVRIKNYTGMSSVYNGKEGCVIQADGEKDRYNDLVWVVQMHDGSEIHPWGINSDEEEPQVELINDPDISLKIDQLKASGRKIAIHTESQEQWDKVAEVICNSELIREPDKSHLRSSKWENEDTCIRLNVNNGDQTGHSRIGYYREKGDSKIVQATEFITANQQPMENKNQQALDRIQELEKELQQIKDSLKEPVYKAGDWIMYNGSSHKNGPYQIAYMEGRNARDINNGLRELSGGNYRHCTPEEIQKATAIKVGEKVMVQCAEGNGVSLRANIGKWYLAKIMPSDSAASGRMETDIANGRGTVVKMLDGTNSGCNMRVYWEHIRRATKEEVAAIQVKTLTVGSNGITVTIKKGEIKARGNHIPVGVLEKIITEVKEIESYTIGTWSVGLSKDMRFIKVGCSSENNLFSINELQDVINAYNKINSI